MTNLDEIVSEQTVTKDKLEELIGEQATNLGASLENYVSNYTLEPDLKKCLNKIIKDLKDISN